MERIRVGDVGEWDILPIDQMQAQLVRCTGPGRVVKIELIGNVDVLVRDPYVVGDAVIDPATGEEVPYDEPWKLVAAVRGRALVEVSITRDTEFAFHAYQRASWRSLARDFRVEKSPDAPKLTIVARRRERDRQAELIEHRATMNEKRREKMFEAQMARHQELLDAGNVIDDKKAQPAAKADGKLDAGGTADDKSAGNAEAPKS